jgi:23S rRNA pseudouridine2604 synthase
MNGVVCDKDTVVGEGDVVSIDNKPVLLKQPDVYIALNKPVGITCTCNPGIEGNILELVSVPERVFPIGRLDKQSQGLILLTNDGEMADQISGSEYGHEKEYEVTVDEPVTELFLQKMASGVSILNTITKKAKVKKVSKYAFRITLTQGLNRQIRRMCKVLGYEVEKLERIRILNIQLGNLKAGKWRTLGQEELTALKNGLSKKALGIKPNG